MSIRNRMTVSLLLGMLLLLGSAGILLYSYMRAKIRGAFDDALTSRAVSLGTLLRQHSGGKVEFDFSDDAMPEFNRSRSAAYFELWNPDGAPLEKSDSLQGAQLQRPALPASGNTFQDIMLPDGRPGRAIFIRVFAIRNDNENDNDDKNIPAPRSRPFILAIARDRTSLDQTLATIAWGTGSATIILALAVGLLAPWLVTRNLHPLRDMTVQASRIHPDALDVRFPMHHLPTELQPICARLNDSLERLQAAFERERRFSANVAHELRTPIAELRLLAEMGLKFPPTPEHTQSSFKDAHAIARQMENIVETLLQMMDDRPAPPPGNDPPVSLAAVLDDAWSAVAPQAQARGIRLTRQIADGIQIHADPAILRRIFLNLFENAVEYAPADSSVDCRCTAEDQSLVVVVANPATNLLVSDLPHLTEPFWRKDGSRTGGRHAGLGLSLVSAYTQRLKGTLTMNLGQPALFEARLSFPCPASPAHPV